MKSHRQKKHKSLEYGTI